MDTAIVLCSGGLNSAVLTALAAQEHDLALLHVNIGHRASAREASNFEAIANHFSPQHIQSIELPHFLTLAKSPRFDDRIAMPPYSAPHPQLTASAIPGLIGSLLWAAHTWACTLSVSKVFIGVSENLGPPAPHTALIWPEYSREFISLAGQALGAGAPDQTTTLTTPLIDLTRSEIIQLGRQLKAPFEHTWSCLQGGDAPCKRCMGCATRARGFLDAMQTDPLTAPATIAG